MTTTIAIVTGTPDRKGPSTDNGATYPTIGGKMTSTDWTSTLDAPLFEAMLAVADGSVSLPFDDDDFRSDPTWHRVTQNWVAGTVANLAHSTTDRAAIVDLDNANGLDVLHVINWVNHIEGADLPIS